MGCFVTRPTVAGVALLTVASLAAGGCSSSGTSSSGTAGCASKAAAAGQAGSTPAGPANPAVAAGWTLPGGNLANTRDVASPITSSDVSTLGVAWCVPIEREPVVRAH